MKENNKIICFECAQNKIKIESRDTQINNLTLLLYKIKEAMLIIQNEPLKTDSIVEAVINEINSVI